MNIDKYFWICPKCKTKVNALEQLVDWVFEDDGEASFMVGKNEGLYFYTIICPECEAEWVMSISGMNERN